MHWWNIPRNQNVGYEYNFSDSEWNLAVHLLVILAALSFVLGAFVFFSYLLFKHKFPSRLITYFSLTTSLDAGTILVLSFTGGNVLKSEVGCTAQGVINQFLASSIILWWLCITVNLYATFVKNRKIAHYEIYMHFFCWGGALAMTIPPALAGQMDQVGLWCWIRDWKWQLGAYYIIMGTCCVVGGIMWMCIISSISSLTQRYKFSDRSAVSVHVLRQSFFVLWFLLVFCFMFAHRFYLHAENNHAPFGLMLLHLCAMGSQGIFVFLVFGMRLEIACFWRSLFHRCLCTCSERGSYQSLE